MLLAETDVEIIDGCSILIEQGVRCTYMYHRLSKTHYARFDLIVCRRFSTWRLREHSRTSGSSHWLFFSHLLSKSCLWYIISAERRNEDLIPYFHLSGC
jgi:hypothetical protein